MTQMEIECCVCRCDMGTKDGHGQTGKTSGLCPECLEIQMQEYYREIAEVEILWLESLGHGGDNGKEQN